MEATGMTVSDVMAMQKYGNRHNGTAVTALGLGVGLGSAALVAAILGSWGNNAASKARYRSAEQLAAAQQLALQQSIQENRSGLQTMASLIGTERASREAWQAQNQPTIQSIIELAANPTASNTPSVNATAELISDIISQANASSQAMAQAINNNSGINSAVGGENFLRVQHYTAPQPCGCGCGQ